MGLSRTPLDERIRQIRTEIDAIIDAKAEQTQKECPGVPLAIIRDLITVRSGRCQCEQYLQIVEGDAA